ncbi:hypothetical protein ABTH79_19800, partial [Acinetobacter baumannii]
MSGSRFETRALIQPPEIFYSESLTKVEKLSMITFKIALANNGPAFSHSCVGARVLDPTRFAACVENVIATGDF